MQTMLELAKKFVASPDHHCHTIDRKMFDIRSSFERFSLLLAEYECSLSAALGRKSDVSKAVS